MKICQTLWCHNQNLLKDSFGWCSPYDHLAAWTFSCLKLSKLYTDIELYTDSQGASILIDKLHLPYTKCHIAYDDLQLNPSLWAYSKILTYNKQKEPFIHVDGDVFVWQKFDRSLLKAPLIAQNVEIGTDYYKQSFELVIKEINYIPELLKNNLFAEQPKAYNAGILGGNNIELITNYSNEAIKFVEQNEAYCSNGSFNIIFEQLLFYSIAESFHETVTCVFKDTFEDNGYHIDTFANFQFIKKPKYQHLLGPHKKNKSVCNQLVKRLLSEYPDYFAKICSLFNVHDYTSFISAGSDKNKFKSPQKFTFTKTRNAIRSLYPNEILLRSNNHISHFVKEKNHPILNKIFICEKRIHHFLTQKFTKINITDIVCTEKKCIRSNLLLTKIKENSQLYRLHLNPYIEIIEASFDITNFNSHVVSQEQNSKKTFAYLPQLYFEGYKEIDLDDISINIISILYEENSSISFHELIDKISKFFERVNDDEQAIASLVTTKLKYLIGYDLIYITK